MAGIYIHIPFCAQACHYCDFHFSTSHRNKAELIECLIREIKLQKVYLEGERIRTIYFGGGTPSLLLPSELSQILLAISENFDVDPNPEITVEANPDDLTEKYLHEIHNSGINRLSIGVQSFFDEDLQFLNRTHNAKSAENAVHLAKVAGFNNITIDLIYGIQSLTNERWFANLQKAIALNVPHLSCYSLTVEPGTTLYHTIRKGRVEPVDPEKSRQHFLLLMDELAQAGYRHYEISNFCKEGFISQHNSSYWRGAKYLGLGPSAHSFNGESRQWNISSNAAYISSIQKNEVPFELEVLSQEDRFNEYILTSLRTDQGLSLERLQSEFPDTFCTRLKDDIAPYIAHSHLSFKENTYYLNNSGKLLADKIASDLFQVSS